MGFIQILNSTAGPPLSVAPRQARPSLNRDPVFMGCMELKWVNSENMTGICLQTGNCSLGIDIKMIQRCIPFTANL